MLQFRITSSSGIDRFGTATNESEKKLVIRRIVRAIVAADGTCRPGFREMIDTIKWADVR